eukprot:GHRR01028244.1.p1 GENE.GHRR01028244.1~~GHRR01028244.1.p1  ORF type:complete len:111 (+),score=12.37 GHRR01028244.1:437-769(+)
MLQARMRLCQDCRWDFCCLTVTAAVSQVGTASLRHLLCLNVQRQQVRKLSLSTAVRSRTEFWTEPRYQKPGSGSTAGKLRLDKQLWPIFALPLLLDSCFSLHGLQHCSVA